MYTKGPWKATKETYPSMEGRITISSVSTEDCIASLPAAWVNRKSNAALIAAAPEMFELLEMVAAGNTEMDTLEAKARELTDRVAKN